MALDYVGPEAISSHESAYDTPEEFLASLEVPDYPEECFKE